VTRSGPTAARTAVLVLGAALTLLPRATPALALAAGLLIALTLGNPWPRQTGRAASLLLQASVVGLGFGIALERLIAGGMVGAPVTALLIVATFAAGMALARWLAVDREVAVLITAGTSICGGSAIAALGSTIGARREAMTVSLATVFVFNAVALYVFPPIAHLAGLSQHQFGIWAAMAIHDTSSVVGAAASYGPDALRDATIFKLARALWILPLVLIVPFAWRTRDQAAPGRHMPVPWFIGLFVLAAVARTLAPSRVLPEFDQVARVGRTALVTTLFLIGASLTRDSLRAVGARPLVLGLVLWIGVAGVSLLAVVTVAR